MDRFFYYKKTKYSFKSYISEPNYVCEIYNMRAIFLFLEISIK
ncbi:hypothetical protein LEP1GSC088_0294 [Leptospira interrogans str. L1207]|nr:hypothetical protein LEP1GSC088_0294 [Leptospira interrogans str. L1207]